MTEQTHSFQEAVSNFYAKHPFLAVVGTLIVGVGAGVVLSRNPRLLFKYGPKVLGTGALLQGFLDRKNATHAEAKVAF